LYGLPIFSDTKPRLSILDLLGFLSFPYYIAISSGWVAVDSADRGTLWYLFGLLLFLHLMESAHTMANVGECARGWVKLAVYSCDSQRM